jgi:hypothetical protein
MDQTQQQQKSTRIILPPALGAFPWLYKPRPPMKNAQNPRFLYQVVLIWKKARKDELAELAAAVKALAAEKFGAQPKGKVRMPLRDGDVDRPGYPEFEDSYFLTASSERKPQVVNLRGQPILEADAEEEAYSGCTFRVSCVPYAYDVNGNRGVSVGMRNIQVVAKGPHLDGGVSAEAEFAEFVQPGGGGGSDVSDIL